MAATAGEKEPRRAVFIHTKKWEGLNLAGIPLPRGTRTAEETTGLVKKYNN